MPSLKWNLSNTPWGRQVANLRYEQALRRLKVAQENKISRDSSTNVAPTALRDDGYFAGGRSGSRQSAVFGVPPNTFLNREPVGETPTGATGMVALP